jgi:hypothetical protein
VTQESHLTWRSAGRAERGVVGSITIILAAREVLFPS